MIKRCPTYSVLLLLGFILVVLPWDLFAQQKFIPSEEVMYRNSYEEAISNKLLPFISQNDFIVHVTIRKDTIWGGDDAPDEKGYGNLPGIFNLSGFGIPMKDTFGMAVSKRPQFRLGRSKMVDIMLSDKYGSREIQFIANLVKWAIPFNENEGDSLIISTVKFPQWMTGNDSGAFELRKPATANAQGFPGGPTYNNNMNTSEHASSADSSGYYRQMFLETEGVWNRTFQVVLILLLLIILFLLIYLTFKTKGRKRGNQAKRNIGEVSNPDPSPDNSEGEKQQLIAMFIKSPKTISSVIESEVLATGQDALIKYVKAIAAANPDLYHLLEPHMNSVTYKNLVSGIQVQAIKGERANEEISQIVSRLKALGELDGQGIFSFLSRINDKQLLFLLRDEQAETIAITIAQLNAERAHKILADFDEALKSEILIHMGQISTQPSSMFRDVALRLNNKLPEFEGMKDISIDGLSGVMNILDSLSDDAQVRMLEKIEERSPAMVAEIKKLFIGFQNITGLDDVIIEKAVRDIDTTEIIQALSGYNKQVQEKVIKTRPAREQLIIHSQLEENNMPLEAGIFVRKKIILSIRNQLRTV